MTPNIYKPFVPKHEKTITSEDFNFLTKASVLGAIKKADEDYLHWEALRYKTWIPEEFSSNKEKFWHLLNIKRHLGGIITPIMDKNGHYFRMNTKHLSEFLHIIDKEMGGSFMGITHFSELNKKQFITRNLIEESIASSQIEGANTSRAVARKMLLEGRKPINHSEQMIVNNHQIMLKIEQEFYKEELSFELICELHSIVTDKTLPEDKKGKLRETFDQHGERLKIIPWSGTVTYVTPDKEFVETELPRLMAFANDKEDPQSEFIHPLIKGIMLHFWIALLHPFEDGNGRLARSLFYWYMLRHDYWAFKYISLSEKIKNSTKQYSLAYVYSEQEPYDLTYFIQYNIEKLQLARKDFQLYIERKIKENRVEASINQEKYGFNNRQKKLLHYLHQETENRTTITSYQQLYLINKVTAITDLKELVTKGFLNKIKNGRNTFYYPTTKVSEIFKTQK